MKGIIDLHCDTVLLSAVAGENIRSWNGHINLEKLRKGGCLAQCFALFIPTHEIREKYGLPSENPWENYKWLLRKYQENLELCADVLRPALNAEDIRHNAGAGFISSVLTVEDCAGTDGNPERFEEMYSDGVRMAALTWNYENCVGFPAFSSDPGDGEKGLKPFGFEAVEIMNSLGMIIDVSHLSEAGFWDVAKSTKKPFVASHSCCKAICGHPRNLTDSQLKAIGDCGGVVGLNFFAEFLADGGTYTDTDMVVRHLEHIRDKAGIDALAWGSDFDGFDNKIEFEDYSGFGRLLSALEGHFTDYEIEKICNGNFLRVFAGR